MSDTADTRGMCQEKSGFLFSHGCEEVATKKCLRCQKAICRDHAHATDQGDVCTTCAKTELKQQVPPGAPRQYNPAASQGVYHSYNPYFYSGYYYPGYGYYGPGYWGHSYYHDSVHHYYHGSPGGGHDPHDFTEGDAGAFHEERDNDFERGFGDS